MRMRAERADGGWRLNGTKTFISNGPVADVVVVFAVTDPAKGFHGGVTAFLVERGVPGFSAGQRFEKMGLRTSPVGELVFDDARAAGRRRAGHASAAAPRVFGTAMDWERALLVAAHVGTMERLLETAIAYARTRTQFGQTIGKFQAVAHKIADMKVQLEAARLLVYRTASRLTVSRTHRARRVDHQALRQRVARQGGARHGAAPRRLRLHGRVRGRARAARRDRRDDLFGHDRDAAQHHRALARAVGSAAGHRDATVPGNRRGRPRPPRRCARPRAGSARQPAVSRSRRPPARAARRASPTRAPAR